MRRVSTTLVALCLVTAVALADDEVPRSLISQAEQVGRAMLNDDHSKLVDLTHPKSVEIAGGREKLIEILTAVAKQMNAKWPKRAITFEKPMSFVRSRNEWFGVIPFTLELRNGDRKASGKSFLLGVSTDEGKSWKFIDGGDDDRAALKKLVPTLPAELRLPSEKTKQR